MIKSRLRVAGVLSLKDGETMEPINFDFSPLAGYYNAKINLSLASAQARSVSSTQASEETATSSSDLPWRRKTLAASKTLVWGLCWGLWGSGLGLVWPG